ncbi:MAG: PAS domain-containing protein, partial [Bacteroidetes bacterium]|nr:PAS domain-containing protein [Bacteroidota bacterium]
MTGPLLLALVPGLLILLKPSLILLKTRCFPFGLTSISARRASFLLNNITDSVIALDRQWRYIFLNDAALSTNPGGKESCLGKVIWEIHPEARGTIFFDIATRVMESRQAAEFDFHYAPLDRWFNLRLFPSKRGLTIFRHDITQQKKLLAEPFKKEAMLQTSGYEGAGVEAGPEAGLIDSIIDSFPGIFYLFTREGRILKWNRNFEKISGYLPHEILRMKPFDFVPDSCHGILMEKIATVFHMGEDVVELDLLPKSGGPVPYFFTGRLVTYAGEPCVLGVGLDCSERVEARLEMKTTTEQLGKLAALLQNIREEERVEIARDIHDDLGQQLTAIKLALFRLEERVAGNSSASEIVEQVIDWTGMTIESVRRISSNLHPGILADQGLLGAMNWQIQEFERKFRIPVTAELSPAVEINDPAIAISLFRVFQEALTNIARHA